MTIIKKFKPETPKRRFPSKYILVAILGLFLLTLTEIWVSNTMVSYGEKFEKLSSLKKNLELENQILQNEAAKKASLSSIASKSAQLGFSPNKSIKYIR